MADTVPTCKNSDKKTYGKNQRAKLHSAESGFCKISKVKGMFRHKLRLDLQMMDCKSRQAQYKNMKSWEGIKKKKTNTDLL